MVKILLKRGRAKAVWFGHPWVFSGAIEKIVGQPAPGDVVDVCDHDTRFIGRGFFSPGSQIRVRVATLIEEPLDAAWLRARIESALRLRRNLGLPSAETDSYRLINSEGDGLPGLIVDIFAGVCAVQFTSLGLKRLEETVYAALTELLSPRAIIEVASGSFAELEGFSSQARVVRGGDVRIIECRENDIRLEVEPLGGQKTGMFLDQRENRRRIRDLARNMNGPRVLDVYTYAGGFALAALRGGAASATCVDSSARALERARRHAEINSLGPLEVIEADAFRFLETAKPRAYDIVIVDPPKFARAQKDLAAALKGYQRLNMLALTACASGALFATCSCSGLIEESEFERMLSRAARDAGRRLRILDRASQGPDHPTLAGFVEGRYLKFVLCSID